MKKPSRPPNEDITQQILASLALVYSPAEERFDRITRLSRRMFAVRTALISIVAEGRSWFKASTALEGAELEAEVAFCRHVIAGADTFIVNDARLHADFAAEPAVKAAPHIRFCAGQPLQLDGKVIGALCILDEKERTFSAEDAESLRNLAILAEQECATFGFAESHAVLDESEQHHRELLIDAVTECWNDEALQYMLPREIALSNRGRSHFSYLHVELQPLPQSLPFLRGEALDAVLKEAARRLKRALRPYDLVARIGPARFAIYAPSCSAEVSELLAERVRARVVGTPLASDARAAVLDIKAGIVSAGPGDDDVTPTRLNQVANLALKDALESRLGHVRLLI